MIDDVLRFSPRVVAAPIVHGNGDCAVEVRRLMLAERFDCLALPLPPSFQGRVEQGVAELPAISVVAQESTAWAEAPEGEAGGPAEGIASYVPIDPCQAVIAAIRIAIEERIPRAFIDLETDRYEPHAAVIPDPYALKKVSFARFAAALLPAIPPVPPGQSRDRVRTMAARLRELEKRFESILFVCSILDWPWVRRAFRRSRVAAAEDDEVAPAEIYQPETSTLLFILGETPYVTGLYERARRELEDDEDLTIDGIKELAIEARRRYAKRHGALARDLSPQTLSLYLKYVRNLSLISNRLTPDLSTLAVAAQQIGGDGFALELLAAARDYPFQRDLEIGRVTFGIERARFPDRRVLRMVSRLPGPPLVWGTLELRPPPPPIDRRKWRLRWDPFQQCSHLPEDDAIERFRSHAFEAAKAIVGLDLARSEKFTTSLKDGLDIRETLRHFWSGEIYVKVNPPTRGDMDCAAMLFDVPAHPRKYPWRATWYAEHEDESTLAFFATNYLQDLVGPGIGRARYGGALFLFPPVAIPDIWSDERLDFTDTLEERLLAAACLHSRHPRIALLAAAPPGALWRKLAADFGKKFVHVPLGRFSASLLRNLRIVHVLNGRHIRSYADRFIRRA